MSDTENPSVRFGNSPAERKEMLLATARELYASGKVRPYMWRLQLIRAVGEKCGLDGKGRRYIDSCLTAIRLHGLTEVRVACIGEDAEAQLHLAAKKSSVTRAAETGRRG